MHEQEPDSWSIHEALNVAFHEFAVRFGPDLLWKAFGALTRDYEGVMAEHHRAQVDIDQYLRHPLVKNGSDLDLWISAARADADQAALLLHVAVRWWRARDDLLSRPAHARVPWSLGQDGMKGQVSLQLLAQMLYRGRAPYTTCD